MLLLIVTLAKVDLAGGVAFGLIASAVCALVGPIFVPFFIVPKLDWLFWSWLKAFIQYSFIPVVAFAFLMVFERFVLPVRDDAAAEDHRGRVQDLRPCRRVVVIGDVLSSGILLVPSLTSSIFSGQRRSERAARHVAGSSACGEGGIVMPSRFRDRSRRRRDARLEACRACTSASAFGVAALIGLVIGRRLDRRGPAALPRAG